MTPAELTAAIRMIFEARGRAAPTEVVTTWATQIAAYADEIGATADNVTSAIKATIRSEEAWPVLGTLMAAVRADKTKAIANRPREIEAPPVIGDQAIANARRLADIASGIGNA